MENFEVVIRSAFSEFKKEMQESIKELKCDIDGIKFDINGIKADINEIKSDIENIYLRLDANDARLASFECEVKRLNFSVDAFRSRFQYLEEDLTSVKQS